MDKIKFLGVMDGFLTYRHEILTVSLLKILKKSLS